MNFRNTLLSGPHYSYPYTFCDKGEEFILPEVASHESPYLLQISKTPRKLSLLGLEHLRLVDSSLVKVGKNYYLFGGHQDSAAGILQLYVSETTLGPYKLHPMSPVVIDPSRARMGGKLLVSDGKFYRFGQDNSDSYGDGLVILEVCKLSPEIYEEKEVGKLKFSDASGPHTIDVRDGRAVLDFYVNEFSILAGYRRLAAKIHAKFSGKFGTRPTI